MSTVRRLIVEPCHGECGYYGGDMFAWTAFRIDKKRLEELAEMKALTLGDGIIEVNHSGANHFGSWEGLPRTMPVTGRYRVTKITDTTVEAELIPTPIEDLFA